MYVRWNRRKRTKTGWRAKKGDYISAVLVESIRVNGKPRQKIIKFLGSIGEDSLNRVFHRRDFWNTSEKNLSALDLSDETMDKIITRLKEVVPRPSEEEIEQEMGKSIRLLKEIHEKHGGGK